MSLHSYLHDHGWLRGAGTPIKVGINYAWKNYAWDFGAPPHSNSGNAWGARAAWKGDIAAELSAFRDLGLFAVRWFLLGDGTTYGIGPAQPRPDAAHPGQWRFDACPSLSPEFLADFEALLLACRSAGLLLLPSLLDFHFCFAGQPLASALSHVKQGRADALLDAGKRAQLLDRVLAPLLTLSSGYRDVIYAWELINEPEWCTQPAGSGPYAQSADPNRTVPQAVMQTYIREGAARINAADFHSTVGFAFHETTHAWKASELGLTLHQFHYYAEPAAIPRNVADPRWPMIVGEFATAAHRPWPELGTNQDVLHRLQHLEHKGYPVAFLWSANRAEESEVPPAVSWSDATQALVHRYIKGS